MAESITTRLESEIKEEGSKSGDIQEKPSGREGYSLYLGAKILGPRERKKSRGSKVPGRKEAVLFSQMLRILLPEKGVPDAGVCKPAVGIGDRGKGVVISRDYS